MSVVRYRVQEKIRQAKPSKMIFRPGRERLKELLDFGRLNSGDIRLSVAATDIESGELVVFDTAKGDTIGLDHLLASCGYLPEFAPVEIDGRFLGDGGLSANAPLEAVLTNNPPDNLVCIISDLYARDGALPANLEEAFARRSDLTFGNQTWQRLESYRREMALRLTAGETDKNRHYYGTEPLRQILALSVSD